MPLAKLISDAAHAVVEAVRLEQKDAVVKGLATRWQRGTLIMQPADNQFTRLGGLQSKEVLLSNHKSEIRNHTSTIKHQNDDQFRTSAVDRPNG